MYIFDIIKKTNQTSFKLNINKKNIKHKRNYKFTINAIGNHNILNGAASIIASKIVGVKNHSKNNALKNFIGVMPMAGEGLRFKKYGHILPKPLIKINNTPMFLKATNSFPKNLKWIFISNNVIKNSYKIKKIL